MSIKNKDHKHLKIVVVDDDPDMVDALSDYLELKNYTVVGKGYSGKDAVQLYLTHKPDLILLDIMMPKYDGFYAIEEIKKANYPVHIIALTADYSYETVKKLNEYSIQMIGKPMDMAKLSMICSKLFNNKES